MKFTSIIFTTLLAVASVKGVAIADPVSEAQSYHSFCYKPGEPCSKLKRAAEAAAEAIAGPQSCDVFCSLPSQPCGKAKRDALALAEATAEAYAAADPEARPCHAPGAPCSMAKREASNDCSGGSGSCKLTTFLVSDYKDLHANNLLSKRWERRGVLPSSRRNLWQTQARSRSKRCERRGVLPSSRRNLWQTQARSRSSCRSYRPAQSRPWSW